MLERKVGILADIFGEYHRTGNEFIFWCPAPWCKHHKPKLSINPNKGVFKCWVCGYSGDKLHKLIRRYGNQTQFLEWCDIAGTIDLSDPANREIFGEDVEIPPIVKLPEEFVTLTSKPSLLSRDAHAYLKSRGFTQSDILWWKMGYCSKGKYKGRIIVPSFDLNGHVNYFIARNYLGNWAPYMNPTAPKDLIFNELYLDWTTDLVLVEGVFDAVKARNAIPLNGSTLRENSHIFEKIVYSGQKVFMALDPDAIRKENNIIQLLLSYSVPVYKIDIAPFKDVGQMTHEEFKERKSKATKVKQKNVIERLLANV